MNGRAQAWQVAGERGRHSRSPIFKFKTSLKTSVIVLHALLLLFFSSRGALHHKQKQQGPTTTATYYAVNLSQARGGMKPGKYL
jgi:hypothetical protein